MGKLEDELLALGGESSDDEAGETFNPSPSPPPKKSTPPTADPKSHNAPQKGVARKMNKRTAASRPRLTVEVDEDEASTGSASPANSLGSGAMSESDEEAAGSSIQRASSTGRAASDGPRYPLEGKFVSQKDKQEIMSLPEARREAILSERMEEVERDNFNKQLRERGEAQKKEAAKSTDKKKRSATAASLDEPERKTTKKTAAMQSLENYKKQREMKHEQRRRPDGQRVRDRDSEELSDNRSRSSSSVADEYLHRQRQDAQYTGTPIDLKWADRIRLSRSSLSLNSYTPGFELVAKGCFVRVALGPDPQTHVPMYKVFLVHDVVTGKAYGIQTPSDNDLQTDQYFVVRPGKHDKVPFTHCSDSPPTMAEWEAFKTTAARENLALPSQGAAESKLAALLALKEYQWTSEELRIKLQRSKATRPRIDSLSMRDSVRRREVAQAAGNEAAVAEEDAIIARLMDRPKVQGGRVIQAKGNTELDDRINKLNREIRRSNNEDVRKAQARDKRKSMIYEAKLARGMVPMNPFAKVKTVPQIFYDVKKDKSSAGGKDIKMEETGDESAEGSGATTAAPGSAKKAGSNGKPVRQKKLDDEDVFGAMQLDVDVDI